MKKILLIAASIVLTGCNFTNGEAWKYDRILKESSATTTTKLNGAMRIATVDLMEWSTSHGGTSESKFTTFRFHLEGEKMDGERTNICFRGQIDEDNYEILINDVLVQANYACMNIDKDYGYHIMWAKTKNGAEYIKHQLSTGNNIKVKDPLGQFSDMEFSSANFDKIWVNYHTKAL